MVNVDKLNEVLDVAKSRRIVLNGGHFVGLVNVLAESACKCDAKPKPTPKEDIVNDKVKKP